MYDRQELFEHVSRKVSCKYDEPLFIHTLGDFHFGSKNFCESAWDYWANRWQAKFEKDTNQWAIGVGDFFNSYRKTNQRKIAMLDADDVTEDLQQKGYDTVEALYKKSEFLKGNTLVMVNGNHDFYMPEYGATMDELYARKLKAPFGGGFTALHLTLQFGRKWAPTLKIVILHGRSASSIYLGSNLNELERKAREWGADIVVAGHAHQLVSGKGVTMDFDAEDVYDKPFVIQRTGSFYRNYKPGSTNYATKAGYKPSVLSQNYLTIEGFKYKGQPKLHMEYHG